MTQEDKEKVKEIAYKNNILGKYMMDEIEKCCLEMAAWKQEQMIKKAVEWLKNYRQDTYDGFGYIAGIVNDKTIEDFKRAMKE